MVHKALLSSTICSFAFQAKTLLWDTPTVEDNPSLIERTVLWNSSIIRQLLASTEDLCFHFQSRLNEDMSSEEHKALFKGLSTHLDAIFIVIEALDEFSLKHDDQYQLMDTLISLRNAVNESSPGRLRLVVTCRPMDGMLKEMRPASSINMRPPDVVSLSAPAHQETDAAASGNGRGTRGPCAIGLQRSTLSSAPSSSCFSLAICTRLFRSKQRNPKLSSTNEVNYYCQRGSYPCAFRLFQSTRSFNHLCWSKTRSSLLHCYHQYTRY